jgi:hypothetical protein
MQAERQILAGACWRSPFISPPGCLARCEALPVLAFLAPMATAFFLFFTKHSLKKKNGLA